jgi:Putative prokaryotic signal transducing protein
VSDLVRVAIVRNQPEAEIVCSLLRSEQIPCFHRATDFAAGSFDGVVSSAGAREVMVSAVDLERARELLDAQVEDD